MASMQYVSALSLRLSFSPHRYSLSLLSPLSSPAQDLVEAKANVSKRVEYIKGEIGRADNQIKGLETKQKDREQVGGPLLP